MLEKNYTPKCPSCSHTTFAAITDQYMKSNDFLSQLIICDNCNVVLGAVPHPETIQQIQEIAKKLGV